MKSSIHQLPIAERPRERLQLAGADQLDDQELLAIVLGSGSKKLPVLQLSENILAATHGLQGLTMCHLDQLCLIKGIGPAKATLLLAACELGKRTFASATAKIRITSEADAVRHFGHLFQQLYDVHYLLVLFNRQNELLATAEYDGLPELQTVIALVNDAGAYSFGLLRNTAPDEEQYLQKEQEWLNDLRAAAAMLRVRFHDRIIVGDDQAVAPGQAPRSPLYLPGARQDNASDR